MNTLNYKDRKEARLKTIITTSIIIFWIIGFLLFEKWYFVILYGITGMLLIWKIIFYLSTHDLITMEM